MNTSLQHQLVIEVSKDCFAFGIKDLATQEFTRFQHYKIDSLAPLDAQLDQVFSENNWLLASYQDILVIHNNELNTFVPQLLFDETLMGSYLQYTVKIYSTDFFDFDDFDDMKNVYVPYVNYNNYLIDKLGSFAYQHISTVFLAYIQNHHQDKKSGVFACVNQNSLMVCVMEDSKMKLYNRFSIQSAEDFTYYILFVYEQLKISRLQVPLYLMGELKEDYFELIAQFIQHFSELKSEKKHDISTEAARAHFLTLAL